jgi:hypothetical protein
MDGPFAGIISPQRLFYDSIFTVDFHKEIISISEQVPIYVTNSANMYIFDCNTYIGARVENSPMVALSVDSGSKGSKLFKHASKYINIDNYRYHFLNPIGYGITIGLGGFKLSRRLTKVVFYLGNERFEKKQVTYIDNDLNPDFGVIGLIGNDFLKDHLFTYDFKNFKFYFKRIAS